mgnify:CR=1 FL=1
MHACNAIIRKDTNKKFLAHYIYKSCFSPPLSTLLKAINNNHFIEWLGIDDTSVKRLLSETMATAKGHLDQEQQHLQTTKHTTHDDDAFPPTMPPTIKAYNTFTLLKNTTAYTDLTGRFPIQSTQGNNYILLTYDYDSNCILVAPLKNKDSHKIIKGWKGNHHLLTSAGAAPQHYILDNEFSNDFKTVLRHSNITFEQVPPHVHRCNAAERAIHTFKNHFLAGLASMDPTFPIKQWDQLLQQAEITLNLLHCSRVHPNLSAYASIFGHFNFNKTPLAPPGTKVAVHVKPTARKSWGYHVKLGYYIGPALNHYRCFKCYIPATRSIRIADTVKFLPHDGTLPQITIQDQLLQTVTNLLHLLKKPKIFPSTDFGDDTFNAISTLAKLLCTDCSSQQPEHPPPSSPPLPLSTITDNQTKVQLPRVIEPTHAQIPRVFTPHPHTAPRVMSSPRHQRLAAPRHHHPMTLWLHPSSRTRAGSNHFSITPTVHHIHNQSTGSKETMDTLLSGQQGLQWTQALENEWDRLATGKLDKVKGFNTISFIPPSQIPGGHKVT